MQKITEKQLEGAIEELLGNLNDKQKLIISDRYGLSNKNGKTLEAIGKELGITRERVRQIEQSAFLALRKSTKSKNLKDIIYFIKQKLLDEGGFLDRKTFKKAIFSGNLNKHSRNKLAFLLNSIKNLKYQKESVEFDGIWYLSEQKRMAGALKLFHKEIIKFFRKNKKVKTFNQLLKLLRSDYFTEELNIFFDKTNGKKRLQILLAGSKLLDKNIIGEWGINTWGIISQKYAREKAVLILRKYKKPLHFRKLTEYINKEWRDKKALPQTVHNVIIKYDEFIFVESGTYTLSENEDKK